MHSRFDAFRLTPLGAQLTALIDTPMRYIEFAALSRAGVAAVTAVRDDVFRLFPEVHDNVTARQFCGAMTAEVMRRHGHEIVQARGRVPGGGFSYGAVFSPSPVPLSRSVLLSRLAAMPATLAGFVSRMPAWRMRTRPAGSGFALLEHVCHLRDLDAVYEARIRAVLDTHLPVLPSVNGVQLAAERDYLSQDPADALASFAQSRRGVCRLLERLQDADWQRCGVRDGLHRQSLQDLLEDMQAHDREHEQELEELLAGQDLPDHEETA